MSEQQNVALIQALLEAFGRGDVETILNHCTDVCEFYCPGPAIIPYTGTRTGRAEIQGYFDGLLGTQTDSNLTIDEFVAQANTVVALGRYRAKIIATGKQLDSPVVLTFKMQAGKIARHMVIGDTAALAASYTASEAAGS